MMEDQRSKLLVAGSKSSVLKGARALYAHFCHKSQSWIKEFEALHSNDASVSLGEQKLVKLNEFLQVENKYFRANLEVHLLIDPSRSEEPNLAEYEGLITFTERPSVADLKSWLIAGPCDDLQLRITVIDSANQIDLEAHFEALEVFTETTVEDLDTLELPLPKRNKDEDAQGVARVIEAIEDAMWTNHQPHPKTQGYKEMNDPEEDLEKQNKDHKEEKKQIEPKAKTNPNELFKEAEDFFDEEGFEDDMKVFEELMAFKSISSGLNQDQRKKMADQLMTKLAGMFGDDL